MYDAYPPYWEGQSLADVLFHVTDEIDSWNDEMDDLLEEPFKHLEELRHAVKRLDEYQLLLFRLDPPAFLLRSVK